MNSVPILFGYNISGIGNSSVPLALCRHWNQKGLSSCLYGPTKEKTITEKWVQTALGALTSKIAYRFEKLTRPQRIAENYFYKKESSSAYVYLWAGLSVDVFQRFHKQGSSIIIERINCHQATAKAKIDRAHKELNMAPPDNITAESIATENLKLALSDGIFCPSPMVYDSMIENGVDEHKLIEASYGWAPERFPDLNAAPRTNSKPVFLFVGTLCVRKGVPLLLKAWEDAGIDGELVLCGAIDDTIKNDFQHFFSRNNITHIPFTSDIGSYYNKADFFLFPSYEEGGPMVTYEAMAHGVVPLVSQMGAGAIVQDKKNGLVLDLDVETWTTAIKAVASSSENRMELSRAARKQALDFTWEKVAKRRAAGLMKQFPLLWNQS